MWRRLYEHGGRLADRGANLAGNPFAIIVLVIACIAWVATGYRVEMLTLILSVLAITLTQMVLNQQRRHEAALHLKIDEIVHAIDGARDDVMGIEAKTEMEMEALRLKEDDLSSDATPRKEVSAEASARLIGKSPT